MRRHAEFDAVCNEPKRRTPPKPALLPAWCAWTMQADQSVRANNARAGLKDQGRGAD